LPPSQSPFAKVKLHTFSCRAHCSQFLYLDKYSQPVARGAPNTELRYTSRDGPYSVVRGAPNTELRYTSRGTPNVSPPSQSPFAKVKLHTFPCRAHFSQFLYLDKYSQPVARGAPNTELRYTSRDGPYSVVRGAPNTELRYTSRGTPTAAAAAAAAEAAAAAAAAASPPSHALIPCPHPMPWLCPTHHPICGLEPRTYPSCTGPAPTLTLTLTPTLTRTRSLLHPLLVQSHQGSGHLG
jgi:hypothetical protein